MNFPTRSHGKCRNGGFSLLELLAVVMLMGIIAMIAVPRLAGSGDKTKGNSCLSTKGMIEVQAQLWFRNKGVAPAADLNDIMGDSSYFPDGAVICPADGTAYQFDQATMRVIGHTHTDLLN